MSLSTTKTFLPAFLKTLGILFLYIFLGLFLDSVYVVENYKDLQWLANIIMVIIFSITLYKVNKRIREQMMYAVIIAIAGEYAFSLGMGMYTYRLENIPHYIPMGHALVYAGVLYFTKTAYAKSNTKLLVTIFTTIIILYSTYFLIFKNDVFGFVLALLTLLILRKKPRERMFYLTMFLAVAYLEIIGTSYDCWWWPKTAWNKIPFLPSANPPSGISFFYFGLDLGCLWFYKKRHKIAWKRMKNVRKIRLQTNTSVK
ncbi:hypothetical protein [Polaribacter sp. Hel1_85]|uniref:hypothetical protein n=1 Tax=Polaribacter sp. Hel1_85 TaxID=1250005 RepID=UPI00052BA65B|nr:hypothetical protein [Polaribacter sp. Hel1_85]KGL58789.1 conserved hypothetical membrane protein [Polaribacter sp. Hel1_85]